MLTLAEIADEPLVLTRHLDLLAGAAGVFRPLTHADSERLACFLEGLSPESRRLSTFGGYGIVAARELCDAIAVSPSPSPTSRAKRRRHRTHGAHRLPLRAHPGR